MMINNYYSINKHNLFNNNKINHYGIKILIEILKHKNNNHNYHKDSNNNNYHKINNKIMINYIKS